MELDFSSDIIEKLLLKRALTDKKWLNILSGVYDKRWFKVQNLGTILNLTLNYYKKYSSIPNNQVLLILVKKLIEKNPESSLKLSDVQQLLLEIQNLNLNIDENIITQNLKEFIRRNAFYNALFDNSELLERSPENYQKVVDKCLENFDRVQKITFNDTDLGLDYFNEEAMKLHWEFIKNPQAKVHTGWDSLDEYTNGGFLKDGKMLGLFMAQAGLGKSVFMSNLAVNMLKQGLSVVVISLEMSQDVYAQRFDAHISNSNINELNENQTTAIQRIKEFYAEHPTANLYVKEYPPRSIRPSDIQTYLENLKNAGKNFDVIIVDYLNLVLAQNRSDNMYKDGLEVSEKLRALSYLFNVPVISAVQSNTEGMNSETIGMENVSESRGICHTADFLAALYQTDDDRENSLISMRLLKNRLGGRVGKISKFSMNPDTLCLKDITFENEYGHMGFEEDNESEIEKSLSNLSAAIQQGNLSSL